MSVRQAAAILVAILLLALPARADELPKTISYQGKLTNSEGIPVNDGQVTMEFSFYDTDTGGAPIWPSSAPESHDVTVTQGLYNVCIGSETEGGIDLAFDEAYWLEVAVHGETLTPRQQLTAVGYALNSLSSGGVGDGHSLDAVDGDPVDALFVDAEGNVGIGIESSVDKLHVQGGSQNTHMRVSATSGEAGLRVMTDESKWQLFVDDSDYNELTAGAFGFVDCLAGHLRMILDADGNVGIGTRYPQHKLDVEGTVQANAFDTGDIVFRKNGEKLWRMFEDEHGLYLENVSTGVTSKIVLEEDVEALIERRISELKEEMWKEFGIEVRAEGS